MTDQLPPETARRFLDFCIAYQRTHVVPLDSFDALTPQDFSDLELCCPDTVAATLCIPGDLAAMYDGEGTYDHYERAGWVKREAESVAEPEEWGPWVKLAVVGERPDGVEFGEGEWIQSRWDNGCEPRGLAHGCWVRATHYRRERVRCVVESDGAGFFKVLFGSTMGAPTKESQGAGGFCLRGDLWTPATVPEVTAAKAGRDPNGVVAWFGGECPVVDKTRGLIHFRSGAVEPADLLSGLDWGHSDACPEVDIIAYEVTE